MIERLVLCGASGDLAGRFLLPALAALEAAGKLPGDFEVLGAARADWDEDQFRGVAADRLAEHAADVPGAARDRLLRMLRYRQVDVGDPGSLAAAIDGAERPAAVYLALPPGLFPAAVAGLAEAGLRSSSRVALEKPFGEDLPSAAALNAQLADHFDDEQVFRVDHALGMATVQNLLGLRFANRVLESLWSSVHIAEIELLWEETLALEGRAGYFDGSGALRDVIQNHVLQLLSLVAMELGDAESRLADRKSELLSAVRPIEAQDMRARTRRARYTAGRLAADGGGAGREVPSYVEEEGVDPTRGTETFAEVELRIDVPRWEGTRFVLRGGKALARRRKAVVVRFRPPPSSALGDGFDQEPNELRIGIDGPTDISLHLTGSPSGLPDANPLVLEAPPIAADLPPYGRVLLDLLAGGSALSVSGAEAEAAWSIVDPILAAWDRDDVPMEEYRAGSTGP